MATGSRRSAWQASPFMLYTHQALRPEQTAAVTHVDGTSRVQTVSAEQNPYLYRILDAFERRTGVPVLINTSFNLRGEPIVSSPSDALKTFFASGIDCLALEDFLVDKEMPGVADIAPEQLRTVHPITECEAFKALYWSGELPGMVPNLVFVDRDGSVAFESNEVGLKGDPLDPARKLAVVWGNSVVFGAGRGWAASARRLGARLAVPERRPRRRPLHQHSAPRRRVQHAPSRWGSTC